MNIWEIQEATNVDKLLTPERSDEIGREVVENYGVDKQSRKEWEERMENAIKLSIQMKEKKDTPWPNASNVKFPLITIAALQYSARAYPALVKVPDLVKYRVNGQDEGGKKAARAQRIGAHMSYQLLEQDEDWEEEFDKQMIALPILGTIFKKSYFDKVKGHNVSCLVLPQNLVVSYYAKSIEDCERKTEEFELSERQVKEKQLKGSYSEKDLGQVNPNLVNNKLKDERQGLTQPLGDKKATRPFLEQHAYLDLDGDGYEEPYVVTVDHSSKKVVRIIPRFGDIETEQSIKIEQLTDEFKLLEIQIQSIMASIPPPNGQQDVQAIQAAQKAQQAMIQIREAQGKLREEIEKLDKDNKKNPKVIRIEPQEYYTKYSFIPSPDGGFYDLGLGALLGPINDSVDTMINQIIDAGTLNNGSHGFIGRGARIQGGRIRFNDPFEWKRVNVAGGTLRDSLVPLPVNPPSPVLFQMLSLLINYAERVSSVNSAMSGSDVGQNTPAYNYHAMLEQGLQVFNGIFKRCYRSFRKELKKLYVLNRQYLNPIEYFETIDGPAQVLQNDYSGDEKDIVPAADPNAFSNMENLMKAHFLAERSAQVPGYHTPSVELQLLEAMDIPNIQRVYPLDEQGNPVIPPPKNPEIELKAAEEQRRTIESQNRQEISWAQLESTMDVNESVVLLNRVKANAIPQETAIKRFEAISQRAKERDDMITDRMQLVEARRERSEKKSESGSD